MTSPRGPLALLVLLAGCADPPQRVAAAREAPAPGATAAPAAGWADAPRPTLPAPPDAPDEPAIDEAPVLEVPDEVDEPVMEVAVAPTLPDPPPEIAPAAPPAFVPSYHEEVLVEKGLKMVEDLVSAVIESDGSCARMADRIQTVLTSNEDLIAEAKQMALAPDPAREAWFKERAEGPMMASMTKMMVPLQACINDEKVQAVFKSVTD